jgi:hypothetical protein
MVGNKLGLAIIGQLDGQQTISNCYDKTSFTRLSVV